MGDLITTAFVLCAGLGTRMGELRATCPKPLLPVWGQPMLAYTLARLHQAGISRLVVNTHYLAQQIEDHLGSWQGTFSEILISREATLLGVGGGLRAALPLIRDETFFVVNGDILMQERPSPSLGEDTTTTPGGNVFSALKEEWHANTFQASKGACLLTLIPRENAWGYEGLGDFFRDDHGHLSLRTGTNGPAPFVYGGVQVMSRACVLEAPSSSRMLSFWETAHKNNAFHGKVWPGPWFHVGTPEALRDVQSLC